MNVLSDFNPFEWNFCRSLWNSLSEWLPSHYSVQTNWREFPGSLAQIFKLYNPLHLTNVLLACIFKYLFGTFFLFRNFCFLLFGVCWSFIEQLNYQQWFNYIHPKQQQKKIWFGEYRNYVCLVARNFVDWRAKNY